MEMEPTLSPSLAEVLIGAFALVMIVASVILVVSLIRRGRPGASVDD
jgi:hypothetical protein